MKNFKVAFSFILSFLLLFNTMIFILSLFVSQRLLNPNFYLKTFEKQGLYNHIYESMDKNFTNLASVTNLPKSLFNDVISPQWIKEENEQVLKETLDYIIYKNDKISPIDTSKMVRTFNSNLEAFKTSHQLNLTINAEKELEKIKSDVSNIVNNQVNFVDLSKISRSNSFEKIRQGLYYAYTYKAALLVLIAINILLLLLIHKKKTLDALIWSGYSFFVAGIFILIPSGLGLITKIAYNLNMSEVVIKNIVITFINDILKYFLYCGSATLVLGLVLVLIGVKSTQASHKGL